MASATRVNDKIDETLKELDDLKNKYERLRNSRETDKEDMKSQIKECKDDYENIRKKIDETLKALDEKFSKEAADMEEKMTIEIDNHVTKADNALTKIKSLEKCKKPKDDDVIFDRAMELNAIKSEYETVCQEIYPFQIDFKPNDDITDLLPKLKSLGTLQMKKRRYIDVGSRNAYDCTFIKDNHIVLACGRDGLKLLDKHFNLQSQLPDYSVRVATINNNQVIVTQGKEKKLQIVNVFPTMSITKKLDMDRKCFGVCVHHNDIYVTCHDDPGNGEVRVLNLETGQNRRIGESGSTYMFKRPFYITVSQDGSKLFVSDVDKQSITCLSIHGRVQYEYTDIMLDSPSGMSVDDQNTLLVCGAKSHNVQEIKDNGRMQKVVGPLSSKDGVLKPLCISRRHDGYMVVGLSDAEKALVVFQVK